MAEHFWWTADAAVRTADQKSFCAWIAQPLEWLKIFCERMAQMFKWLKIFSERMAEAIWTAGERQGNGFGHLNG